METADAGPDLESFVAEGDPRRLFVFTDRPTGLRALLVIDDLTLGPAVGGTRTMTYPSAGAAAEDARRLARAMTVKAALAGLDAGGAKLVVMDGPELRRAEAFRVLGSRINELGDLFYTAGDLGTRVEDLEAMAERTGRVRTDEQSLATAVARGLAECLAASARLRGHADLTGLRVAVQGCGAIGDAVCRALAAAGVELSVADLDPAAAERTAAATGARILDPEEILFADVDAVAPCAAGGVLDRRAASALRAWAVCGAANNILREPHVANILADREIFYVPEALAGAGAIIAGLCDLKGDGRTEELITALGHTTREILEESLHDRRSALAVAEERARARIAAGAR